MEHDKKDYKFKESQNNSLLIYYDNQIKYLQYIRFKLLIIFPIFLLIMIWVSQHNKNISDIIAIIYFCCVINIIQDYNIFYTLGSVLTRMKRRRYLYKKLKQRKK